MDGSVKEYVESEKVDVVKIFSKDKNTAIELLESSSKNSVISKYLSDKSAKEYGVYCPLYWFGGKNVNIK